ncbi:MAG: hypothetical protein DBX59_08445 [Bacillota bacterium]|nr:MAG: hypothetical protein DBX59_08445 [Bacillota bacterium]
MEKNKPVVAICYDFDKTLSPKDMQTFSLLPKLNCPAEEFWAESNEFAKKQGVDKILAYMYLILHKAQAARVRLSEQDFKDMGREIELFSGVEGWFDRIDAYAEKLGVAVEHYIISAGLKEIISGTAIADKFTEIYASSFIYDEYGAPEWPRQVVNYTTKTQYLFRISKNSLDLSDEDTVNRYIPDGERRIPFQNFIYIGDSETDIPAMKIVKNGGGTSVGVYNAKNGDMDRARALLQQRRVDYLLPADYSEGSILERTVQSVMRKIGTDEELGAFNERQLSYAEALGQAEQLKQYIAAAASGETAAGLKKYAERFLEGLRKKLRDYDDTVPAEVSERFISEKKAEVKALIAEKTEKKAENRA